MKTAPAPQLPIAAARRTEPRDGGVLNPATAGRYSVFKETDVSKRFKAERARLRALQPAPDAAPCATVVALQPARVRP